MKRITYVFVFGLLIVCGLLLVGTSSANDIILGNRYYDSDYMIVSQSGGIETVLGNLETITIDCYVTSISCWLEDLSGEHLYAECGLYYSSNNSFIDATDHLGITSFGLYVFDFLNEPYLNNGEEIYICVYADAPGSGVGVVAYGVGTTGTGTCWEDANNYPIFPATYTIAGCGTTTIGIYLFMDNVTDSTSLTVYNNTQHTTGKYETAYSSSTGWSVWMNFTGAVPTIKLRENLNAYLSGTHQSRWNASTWIYMAWANYSGATLKGRYNKLNAYQSGTNQNRYNSTTNIWMDWTNVSGASEMMRNTTSNVYGTHQVRYNATSNLWMNWANYSTSEVLRVNLGNAYLSGTLQGRWNATTGKWMAWANYSGANLINRQTIVNASGTHQSRYNSTTNNWMSWANYTGSLTPLHIRNNTVNVLKSFIYKQNGTGWWVYDNDSTSEKLRENLNSYLSGTHQGRFNSSTGVWMAWANYSGPDLVTSETIGNATGSHDSRYNSSTNKWMAWANYTSYQLLRQTIVNASGTHQGRWNATSGRWMSWANYTGNGTGGITACNIYNNSVNVSGTVMKLYYSGGVGWKIFVNHTGNLTALHLAENIGYSSGTHASKQNGTGYWVWANYTSALGDSSNIVNATGVHQHRWNSSTNTWWDWANYTGDLTPLHDFANIGNASGTHAKKQNSTGWWIWANYTSHLGNSQTIVNATGVHQSRWNVTSGYWWDWANYTGSLTPIHSYQNIVNATGTHTIIQNGTGYWDWANYTGNLTALHMAENIINATGSHDYLQNSTGWWVWANYTGNVSVVNSTALTLFENILNASGSHNSVYDAVTGWKVWANYTGNLTALNFLNNHTNTTWSHVYKQNSTGYWVYDNDTGNTTPIFLVPNVVNCSGILTYWLNSIGYTVFANYQGNLTPIHSYQNIVNATGTHTIIQNGTGYWDWANYTGNVSVVNSTALTLFENILYSTGTHDSQYNSSTGWKVWANYSSNLKSRENLNSYLSGTHQYRWNATTGIWMSWANYTGADLVTSENIVDATGSHDSRYNATTNKWIAWANYTGTASGGATANLTIINPNPGNGTHQAEATGFGVGGNYQQNDSSGITTSVDVSCINFTTPASVLPGSYNITVNSTAFSNTPSTWNTSTVYSSVWGNSTGGIAPGGNLYVGQMEDSGDYSIFRSYLRFNTSSLPDDAVINSAYVKLVVWGDYSDTDFNVTLQSVKPPKPHNPLIPSDYSKVGIAGHHGHENTTGYVNDDIFNITLTNSGLLDINITGMTRWSVRSNKDINATTPGADTNEFIIFYGNVLPVTNYPKLIINYTVPSSSWSHIVNLTFYNVSSGLSYATVHATGNGTVTVPATVFNGIGTYQWNVSYDNNGSSHGDTQVFTFVTVNASGAVVNLTSYIPFGGGVVYKLPLLVGMTIALPGLLLTRRRRRQRQ